MWLVCKYMQAWLGCLISLLYLTLMYLNAPSYQFVSVSPSESAIFNFLSWKHIYNLTFIHQLHLLFLYMNTSRSIESCMIPLRETLYTFPQTNQNNNKSLEYCCIYLIYSLTLSFSVSLPLTLRLHSNLFEQIHSTNMSLVLLRNTYIYPCPATNIQSLVIFLAYLL